MKIKIEAPSGKVCRMVDVEPGTPGRDEDGDAVIRIRNDGDPGEIVAVDEDGRLWFYDPDAMLVVADDVGATDVVRGAALREYADGRRFEVVATWDPCGDGGATKGDRGHCPDGDYRSAGKYGEPAMLWCCNADGDYGWVTVLRPLDD